MGHDGLSVAKKVRGNTKAIESMIATASSHKGKFYQNTIHIASMGSTKEELTSLKKALTDATGVHTFYEYPVGCTLASHTGNGVYGLGYFLDPDSE